MERIAGPCFVASVDEVPRLHWIWSLGMPRFSEFIEKAFVVCHHQTHEFARVCVLKVPHTAVIQSERLDHSDFFEEASRATLDGIRVADFIQGILAKTSRNFVDCTGSLCGYALGNRIEHCDIRSMRSLTALAHGICRCGACTLS